MIRFAPGPEPVQWDARCRQRGRRWLGSHPGYDRPYDYWTEFEPDLRAAFRRMCGYCAMAVMKAEMDHFRPVAVLKREGRHELAYEWDNFRYGLRVLNRRKSDCLVLDPFAVRDDWFEVLLPSLQLVLTERVTRKVPALLFHYRTTQPAEFDYLSSTALWWAI